MQTAKLGGVAQPVIMTLEELKMKIKPGHSDTGTEEAAAQATGQGKASRFHAGPEQPYCKGRH